mgnify:CR=1 FL=1
MQRFDYPALDETAYRETLPNGLRVVVVPQKGFAKKLAYFATDFGSIHTAFRLGGQEYTVPAGVAHYLEHKMFDLPGGRDVSAEFAALGAHSNAFTSYDMTAYYFSCTEHFEENLKLLLEFVSTPYFTQESVDKERGIIDQEIGMNEDSPDSALFELLAAGMYRVHPLRVPILGTHETIREITPETLYLCHRAFYAPGNMTLCVLGDVDPEGVAALARQVLGDEKREVAEKLRDWQEDMTPAEPYVHANMEVAMPTFTMAFKCESPGTGEEAIRQEMVADLAAEALFGESSELYLRLSNWLVIRRREVLQLKSHAMQVLQLIWRGLFVDMAQQVIAASELKDERLSARRQAVFRFKNLFLFRHVVLLSAAGCPAGGCRPWGTCSPLQESRARRPAYPASRRSRPDRTAPRGGRIIRPA